ncbi:class I SAM-dependent methyltransferase [Rhodopseudomonas palustris]|uniref:class I SAM-dependent methyltransferase n=1 Tax=Rhodopseudomonas palustris TaxID=1076 RepID=UPI00105882F3|nr:class I SAM-dependent methyltransferase [Rhodopseudomonas palustris]QLH73065.1 class I SAM-dependent methyltransferase [Rhodopseudomonas palustris]
MAAQDSSIARFARRAQDAALRRMIAVAKRVAGPTIRRALAQEREAAGAAAAPAAVLAGDDQLLSRMAAVAGDGLRARYPNSAQSDAVVLELARLIAPKLALLPGNPAHDIFYANGMHLLPKHYYLPIPDDGDQLDAFWTTPSKMVGVDTHDEAQLHLMKSVFPRYLAEFREQFPINEAKEFGEFFLLNGSYMAVDSHVYYSLIRQNNPERIVEIGCGNSTFLACAAAKRNQQEFGRAPSITAIEPYPWEIFRKGYPGLTEVVAKKVQDVPLEVFTSLKAGDILFIDSTHALRSGSDVQYEFLEILPRLQPGVLVHIHDISLPLPYPKVYYDQHIYWNEQYLLQAFLAFNSRFDVHWAGNYMLINHREAMLETFPEFKLMREKWPSSEPSAFWIRSM